MSLFKVINRCVVGAEFGHVQSDGEQFTKCDDDGVARRYRTLAVVPSGVVQCSHHDLCIWYMVSHLD